MSLPLSVEGTDLSGKSAGFSLQVESHVVQHPVFSCGLCHSTYKTFEEADGCYQQGFHPNFSVGDIVHNYPRFGWFDGDEKWAPLTAKTPWGKDLEKPLHDFIYVVTAVDFDFYCDNWTSTYREPDPRREGETRPSTDADAFLYRRLNSGHRVRYHVFTLAMTGKQGYRSGYTFDKHHVTLHLLDQKEYEWAKKEALEHNLIGQKAGNLL